MEAVCEVRLAFTQTIYSSSCLELCLGKLQAHPSMAFLVTWIVKFHTHVVPVTLGAEMWED